MLHKRAGTNSSDCSFSSLWKITEIKALVGTSGKDKASLLSFLPSFISAVSILIQLSLYTHKYIMYTFTHIYIPICKYKLRISLVSI